MIFGNPQEFAITVDIAGAIDRGRPREYGYLGMIVAGTHVNRIDTGIDWLPPFADFLDAVLRDGQSQFSEMLLGMQSESALLAVFTNVYAPAEDGIASLRPGCLGVHLLAPNGSCAFDGCMVVSMDAQGHSHVIAITCENEHLLSEGIAPPVLRIVMKEDAKQAVLRSACRWIRGGA